MNHLEQLIAEWYDFRGYFVRRNVHVGKRSKGGYECELDIVAFCPQRQHLVHIEPSMDADKWSTREARYKRKFEAGRKYIPSLFDGIVLPIDIEQIALFVFASTTNVKTLAGGRIMTYPELLADITSEIKHLPIAKSAIPERYSLLRAVQFAYQYRRKAGW